MRYIILGTAGHIDHGKSSLVKALTGIDPDRLKEEKERGITIDLGFADLSYPDGLRIGIVDVPGHEGLVRNMLAGAGGIDLVLLVIAADEGIMPQSKEHLAICDLLKIKSGLIAITKADLVEKDWLEMVISEAKDFAKDTFLEGCEIVPVSSKTSYNIDLLKEKIRGVALKVKPKPSEGLFRLPIDRVFTLKGFGTVVTGTALSGSISIDDAIEILPAGIKSKVRGLQSHGETIKTAYAGQRVALNLQGIQKEDIQRGDVLAIPDRLKPTTAVDAEIELLRGAPVLKNRDLIHFHIGTSELTGRIILYNRAELEPGSKAYCQIRLKEPVIAMNGDRYIIRRFSPLETIGGGEILDPSPKRRRKGEGLDDLVVFKEASLKEKLSMKILKDAVAGSTISTLEGWINAELPAIAKAIEALIKTSEVMQFEDRLLHKKTFTIFQEKVNAFIDDFHKKYPLKIGVPKEDLRAIFKGLDHKLFGSLLFTIKEIAIEKEFVKAKSFMTSWSGVDTALKEKIIDILEKAAFQPPLKDELSNTLSISQNGLDDILRLMSKEGRLVRINDSLFITASNYSKMMEAIKNFFRKNNEMTVAEFRDILSTSRKYALPFLEHLDSNKITLRVGDKRKFLGKPY